MDSVFACALVPVAQSSVLAAARAAPSFPRSTARTGPVTAVLSKPNRVVRAEDFRATMRKGKRLSTEHALLYIAPRSAAEPARFGFVVAKSVGGSVTRNLLRRRLRAIGYDLVQRGLSGKDVVVRPLPGSEKLSWASLQQEIYAGIEKGTRQ